MRNFIIIMLTVFGLIIGGYSILKPVTCLAGFCLSSRCSSNAQCGQECYCHVITGQEEGYCTK